MYNLAVFSVYLIELVIAYVFFFMQGEPKRKTWVCWMIGAALFSAGMLEYILLNRVWLNTLCDGIILFLFGALAFKITWKRALFDAVVLDILVLTWDFAVAMVLAYVTGHEVTAYTNNFSFYVMLATISKTLYFLSSIVLAKCTCKENAVARFPMVFYVYPFTVVAVLIALWGICMTYQVGGLYLILISVLCMILQLSTILLFISYQRTAQRENEIISLQTQLEKIETDKRYYDILEKQNEDLMIYAHDTKKLLSAIRDLTDDAQIRAYLAKMAEQLRRYSRIGHSGNKMLDVICNKYSEECALYGISLELDVHLANFKYVDDFDLVAIFGNIFDNALEAAQKSQERKIALLTDRGNTYDIITLTNSCDRPPITSGRELQTTKPNARLHGLGIKSLKKTLRKYDGDCDWHYDAELRQFSMTIMLSDRIKSTETDR